MRKGEKLIAKDTFYMKYNGVNTSELFLIGGKSYSINDVLIEQNREITILIDTEYEKNQPMYQDAALQYFYTTKESRLLKLKKLNCE